MDDEARGDDDDDAALALAFDEVAVMIFDLIKFSCVSRSATSTSCPLAPMERMRFTRWRNCRSSCRRRPDTLSDLVSSRVSLAMAMNVCSRCLRSSAACFAA